MGRKKSFQEDDIINRAKNLFWRKGYHATSAQDLVDGLGINRSSIYDSFGDKRQLFLSALAAYQEEMAAYRKNLFESSDSVLFVIRTLFQQAIQESIADRDAKGCFFVNTSTELASSDPELAKLVNDNQQQVEKEFLHLVKKGQAKNEITTAQSARAISRFLYNTFTGLKVAGKTVKDKSYYDDVLKVVLKTLEH